MVEAPLAELLAWGGLPDVPPRARFLVVDALDDHPGQASAAAWLAEHGEDVAGGARLLARAAGARQSILVVPEGRGAAAGAPGAVEPDVLRLAVPRLHPLGQPGMLARWLCREARFDGAAPADFVVVSAFDAAAAAAAARGRPLRATWITVAGRVRNPGTVRVPLGTPVAALARLAGGCPGGARPYRVARGQLRPAGSSEGVTGADGLLLYLPEGHLLVRNDDLPLDALLRRADSACARCGLCDASCPSGDVRPARLLDALRAPGGLGGADLGATGACTGCRVCETACPVGLGIGRIARETAARMNRGGRPEAPASRRLRLMPRDAMRFRLGLGPDPTARRDAFDEVRRVRFALRGGVTAWRALGRVGDRVWAGDALAIGPGGARILAPFAGTVTRAGDSITLRRSAT